MHVLEHAASTEERSENRTENGLKF